MNDADIERRLENHLLRVEEAMRLAFREATAKAAKNQALQSGGHLLEKARIVGDAMDRFVQSVTDDADAVERSGSGTALFYETAHTKLIQLHLRGRDDIRSKAEAWAGHSATHGISAETEKRYLAARCLLTDHQAGFGRRPSPAAGHATILLQDSPGAVVQSHSPGAWAQTHVDMAAVAPALDQLEAALHWDDLSAADVHDIRADIATIRAQIGKRSPSSGAIVEAGRSMRAILENLAASAVQPAAWAGALVLWRALGLAG